MNINTKITYLRTIVITILYVLFNQPIAAQVYNLLLNPDGTTSNTYVTSGTYVTIKFVDTSNSTEYTYNNKYLTLVNTLNGPYLRAMGTDRSNIKSIFQIYNHTTSAAPYNGGPDGTIGIQNLVVTDPVAITINNFCYLDNNPSTYGVTFPDATFGPTETWVIQPSSKSPYVYLKSLQTDGSGNQFYTYLTVREAGETWSDPTNGASPGGGWCWTRDSSGAKKSYDYNTCSFVIEPYTPMASTPPSVLWGIDANKNIWFSTGITDAGLTSGGMQWTQIPGALKDVSVAHNGAVWGVDTTGAIVYRYGVQQSNPSGTTWMPIDSPSGKTALKVYGGVAGALWAIATDTTIWYRNGITSTTPIGTGWTQISGSAISLGLGTNGEVWAADSAGALSFRTGTIPTPATPITTPTGTSWITVAPPSAMVNNQMTALTISQVTCGKNGYVWVLASDGTVYFKLSSDPNDLWTLKSGFSAGQYIAYGPTGQVWALSKTTNPLFTLPGVTDINPMGGSSWTNLTGLTGSLMQLSVGPTLTAFPQTVIAIPDATNGNAAGRSRGQLDGQSGVTGTTAAVIPRDDPSIPGHPDYTGPTLSQVPTATNFYSNAITKAIFLSSYQQAYDSIFFTIRGGIDGANDGTNISGAVAYKFGPTSTVSGKTIATANVTIYQSYYDAAFYPARGTKDGLADGSNPSVTTPSYKFNTSNSTTAAVNITAYQVAYDAAFYPTRGTLDGKTDGSNPAITTILAKNYRFSTANTNVTNANAYSTNYNSAFTTAQGSPADYSSGLAAGQTAGTTDGNTGKTPVPTTTGNASYQTGYTTGYTAMFYPARGTLDGKTDGSNLAITAANYKFNATTYPAYKTAYDTAFSATKADYTNGVTAGKSAGTTDGNNPTVQTPVTTTTTGSALYQAGYTAGYTSTFYTTRGTLDGKTDGSNPSVTAAHYKFSVTTYPAYKTAYDTAFAAAQAAAKIDHNNGITAGQLAGTADGNNPTIQTPVTTTTTGSALYQSGYTTGYTSTFYTTRGTLDGNTDTANASMTTPNYKFIVTTYPDYKTAYDTAFYTAARGTIAGTAAANATPPGPATLTGFVPAYSNAYSAAFNTAFYTAARGTSDGAYAAITKAQAAPTAPTNIPAASQNAYNNAAGAAFTINKSNPLVILHASFGNHNVSDQSQQKDVTSIIANNVQNNQFPITPGNYISLFGDPSPSTPVKTLLIIYVYGTNQSIYASFTNQNQSTAFPTPLSGIELYTPHQGPAGFNVLKAWYGDPQGSGGVNGFLDVTAKLPAQHNNQITIAGAFNNLFTTDPAPGIVKGLLIIFRVDESVFFQSLGENETGTISPSNALATTSAGYAEAGTIDGTNAVTSTTTTLPTAPTNKPAAYQAAFNIAAANAFYTATRGTNDGAAAVTSTTTTLPVAATTLPTVYQTAYNTAAANNFYTAARGTIDGTNAVATATTLPVAPLLPLSMTLANYTPYQTAFNTAVANTYYTPARGAIDGANAITITTTILPPIPAKAPSAYQSAFITAASNALVGQLAGFARGTSDSKAGIAPRNDPTASGHPDNAAYNQAPDKTAYKNFYTAGYNAAHSIETQVLSDMSAGTTAGNKQAVADVTAMKLKQYCVDVATKDPHELRYMDLPATLTTNIAALTNNSAYSTAYTQAFISSYDNEYEMYVTGTLLAEHSAGTANGSSDSSQGVAPTTITPPTGSNILVQDLATAYNNAYNTFFYTAARGTTDGTTAGQSATSIALSSTGYTSYDNAYNTAFLQARGTLDGTTDGANLLASPNYQFNNTTYITNYDAVFTDTKKGTQAGTTAGTQDAQAHNTFNSTAPAQFNNAATSTIFAAAYTLAYANAYYTIQGPLDGQADGTALNDISYKVTQTQPGFAAYKTAYDAAYQTAHDAAVILAEAQGTSDAKTDAAQNVPERSAPKTAGTTLYNTAYMSTYITEYESLATNALIMQHVQNAGTQLGTSDADANITKNLTPVPPTAIQSAYHAQQNYKDAFNTAYNNAYDAETTRLAGIKAANQAAADTKAGTSAGKLAGSADGTHAATGTPAPTVIPAPPAGSPTSTDFITAYNAAYTSAFTAANSQSSSAKAAADAKAGTTAGQLAGTTDGTNAAAGTPAPTAIPAPPAGSPTSTAFVNAFDAAYTSAFTQAVAKKTTPPTKPPTPTPTPKPKPKSSGPSKGSAQTAAAQALQKLLGH